MANSLGPAESVHLFSAVAALLIGPFALAARKGSRLHRAAGYAWVTCIVGAALSSAFIRSYNLPNIAGYTPIHVLTIVAPVSVFVGLRHMVHGRIDAHRKTMWGTYLGSCVVAGLFTLLPSRYLGHLLWHDWLGVL